LVSGLTLPLVEFLGKGDQAKGYQLTIAAMSILGVAMFLACFWGTKERLHPPIDQQTSFKKDFTDMLKNDQWRVLAIAAVCLLSGMVLRTSLAIYYVKYFLNMPDSITLFITLGMVGNIFGCILAQPLAKRFCKVKAYITLQLLAAAMCVVSYFVPSDQVILAFGMYVIWGFTFNMATPLLWAKMADVVDYGQHKNGVRITGMIYSSVIFFIKLGVAIGGAAAGWLLAGYGYQPDIIQTEQTQQGILLSFTVYPAIGSLVVAFVMRWYTLDNEKVDQIHLELNREVK
jgi:glycoside/pentoside/hexuronide:cation symporter, GPH family